MWLGYEYVESVDDEAASRHIQCASVCAGGDVEGWAYLPEGNRWGAAAAAQDEERGPAIPAGGGAYLAGQLNFFASNTSVRPVSGTEFRRVCYGNPSDSAAGYLSSDEVTGLVPLLSVCDWTGDGVDEWAMLRGSRDVGGPHIIPHGTALSFGDALPVALRIPAAASPGEAGTSGRAG